LQRIAVHIEKIGADANGLGENADRDLELMMTVANSKSNDWTTFLLKFYQWTSIEPPGLTFVGEREGPRFY